MSLATTKLMRGYLVSSSAVIAKVPSRNIKVGWVKTTDSFPCITINQVTGTDIGFLGYNSSEAGSRMRRESASIQIDIFSQKDRLETIQIADLIVPIMISGGCRKDSDFEDYLDELNVYRKIQTYRIVKDYDD